MGRTCLLVVSATATLGVYGLYKIAGIVYREWASPLRVLPGTKSPSFIYGDLKELWEEVCRSSFLARHLLTSPLDNLGRYWDEWHIS